MSVLGVLVDSVTRQEALSRMEALIESGGPHQVATVNPEFVMGARRDPAFRKVLDEAALALPDGIGVVWASRWLGRDLPERVAGVDLVWELAGLAARRGYGIFCLGAVPGVAEETARRLSEWHPGLRIAGCHAGSPSLEEEGEIVARVRASGPQVLFVAYGAPRQDVWIHRNLEALGVPLAMGVGGAFDFIAGRTRRAPGWMRWLGLEWLHRLAMEPWRWRRMLALPRFAALAFAARWRAE